MRLHHTGWKIHLKIRLNQTENSFHQKEYLFLQPGLAVKWKNSFSPARKNSFYLLRAKKFFFKNWHSERHFANRFWKLICQWKPYLKLGEIQFLKNIPARGSLFVVVEMGFSASGTHFCSPFLRLLSVFFRLVEKYFYTKFFIPADGNRFSGQWKPFSFAQSFFSRWKQLLKLMEANFQRKTIF